jgi:hypothetical protein
MMAEEVISGGVHNRESGFFGRSPEQRSGETARSHQNLIDEKNMDDVDSFFALVA